jgi:phospholipid-translocating ATPase
VTSLGAYFAYIWVSDSIYFLSISGTAKVMFTSSLFYWCIVLSVLWMFAIDMSLFSMKLSKDSLLNYMKKH